MRYDEDGAGIYVGHRVLIERDESRWPTRGTWRNYRGRTGTVVSLNRTDHEVGVSWMPTVTDPTKAAADSWFKPWELRHLDGPAQVGDVAQDRRKGRRPTTTTPQPSAAL